jgi:hypothetical protein
VAPAQAAPVVQPTVVAAVAPAARTQSTTVVAVVAPTRPRAFVELPLPCGMHVLYTVQGTVHTGAAAPGMVLLLGGH